MSNSIDNINWKEINRLALPAIIAGIAEPVISLVDTAVIGQLGATELGGVGVGASLFTLIMWVLAQTKSAISAIVSKAVGANNLKSLKSFIPQALIMNFILGASVMIFALLLSVPIFKLYNAQGDLLNVANSYFHIRAFGLPIGLLVFGIFGVFRGLQNTSWAMIISFVGASVNVVLDIILVFGIEGIVPSFGVEGAAWASVISQFIMLALAVGYLYKKTNFQLIQAVKIHPKIKLLLKMSFDLFIRAIALNIAFYAGTSLATSLSDEHVAAFTIGVNIWLFSSFFIDGYSNAGNALAGKLSGGNNFNLLLKVTHKLLKINVVIGALLGLTYAVGYKLIGSFFTDDEMVLEIFMTSFWLIIISQPINAIAFTLDGIFKGLGKTAFLRNLLLGATFLVFIPSVAMFHTFTPGLIGIWFSFILWMSFRGFPIYIKLKSIVRNA